MTRAAIYCRVSTEEQARNGLSLGDQRATLEQYAKSKGMTIVDIYEDAGISARKPYKKRPAILRLLEDVKQKKVDIVLFTKLDRWFRNVGNYYAVQEILDANGVSWAYNKAMREKGEADSSYLSAGKLHATAVLHMLYQSVLDTYLKENNPDMFTRIMPLVESQEALKGVLDFYDREFPSPLLRTQLLDYTLYRLEVVRAFFIHQVLLNNPALVSAAGPLVEPRGLVFPSATSALQSLIGSYTKTIDGKIGHSDEDDIFDFLTKPARLYPNSLTEQIEYILREWADLLSDELKLLLQSGLDFIHQEEKDHGGVGNGGSAPMEVPDYSGLNNEYEAYHRETRTLDQIPDEELDRLAERGFTALWLIGLWERSDASKRIKVMCGNPDAEASAYSLYDYEIAASLGGWPALTRLKERCAKRGIRLSADMVPNHTAIDSRWISIHPDWFLQLPENPYPQYNFNGPDLSGDPNITVQIEDKYYSKEDCAVVFRRYDKNKNENRYIYHGNDGTGLPWNDTAQINFLNPEAKEAVIQVILHVARNFPIIRFDAAMTLAKRHIQRLWFPAPGQGGDIPTRAEHGMLTVDFNKAMPQEFWREVVDRVAAEVPDTLLLAEAFWMMEGYFVRTLGMHRVYNSAFMNMLKKEENAKYRYLIRETLEFDPDILKRYVNFMNNPDEKTAAEQFGKGDKYFGVCLLLATMPGLPMIGHGQIEGFYEKYGMEFSRPQWDEKPDQWLIDRHEREIFPIFRKRYLFSEVVNFRLYNFNDTEGRLNENVFAYSNKCGNENALVVYNNKYESTAGTIKHTVLYKDKADGQMKHTVLADFIGIEETERRYVIFTDFIKSLSYIRSARDLVDNGLFCLLAGYEYQLFTDFHIVEDFDGRYENLRAKLNGSGCEDVAFEAEKLEFEAVSAFFKPIFDKNKTNFKKLTDIVLGKKTGKLPQWKFDEKIKKEAEKATAKLTEKESFRLLLNRKERIFSRIEKNCEKLDKIAQTLSDASPSQTEWLASLIGYHEEWTFAAALSLLAGIPETEEFLNGQILFETVFEALNGRPSVKADRSRTFALLSVFARLLCRKDKTLASPESWVQSTQNAKILVHSSG